MGKLLYVNLSCQGAYSYFDAEWTGSFLTAGGICSLTYGTLWLSVCPHSPDSCWQPSMELRDVICRLYRPPSRTLYLQTARHSSKVIPEEWRGKPVHQEKQMIVLESVYLLAERRRSVHYFNHKKKRVPWEDSSDVFSVKCWASDVMALHTALPYD